MLSLSISCSYTTYVTQRTKRKECDGTLWSGEQFLLCQRTQCFTVAVHGLSLVLFLLSQLWLTWGSWIKSLTLQTAERGQQESCCSLVHSGRGLCFLPLFSFHSAEVGRNLSASLSVVRAGLLSYQLTLLCWPVASSPSCKSFLAALQVLLQPRGGPTGHFRWVQKETNTELVRETMGG